MKRILVILALLLTPAFALAQFTTQQGGTGTTTPSGILYGDGTLHLKTVGIGNGLSFLAGVLSASGGSGSVTQVNTAYPVTGGPITTTGTVGLAFGTTTSNIWAATQTFTNAPVFSSLTGLLKGNGSSALTVGVNGTDFTLNTAKICNSGDFISAETAAGVYTCTTPAGTTYTATYPIIVTGSVISTAFGTTTSNTFAGTQTFTNSPVLSTLGAGAVNSTSGGTVYNTATSTPSIGSVLTYTGTLGNLVGGISGSFSIANSAVTNAMLVNSTIGATSPNSTLTFGSAAALGSTFTGDLNLAHSNIWTAKQTFNAQTDMLGPLVIGTSTASTTIWGATATSTFASGISLTNGGCFAIAGACLTAGSIGGGSTEAVNWATTAVLAGTPGYLNGTAGVGATLIEVGTGALSVDGNSPAMGDRVLVKNQASALQNGIYVVTATGSGIASYTLTRASDYNTPTEITPGITTYVLSGTANTDTTWAVSYTPPLTIGTNSLNYSESAGTGGTVTSVAASVPGFLSISGSPITTSGTLAISYSGTALPVANGGTGATSLTGDQFLYTNHAGTAVVTVASTSLNLPNAALLNSTISGVALGGTLASHSHAASLSGTSYNGSAAVSDWAINTANSNSWSVLQSFTLASTSQLSVFTKAYFGGAASTTIDSTGNIVIPSGSNLTITGKTDGCATFATGVLNSTGTACGSGGGASFAYPFSALTTYGTTTAATSTSIYTAGGFFSSTTVATSSFSGAVQLSAGNIMPYVLIGSTTPKYGYIPNDALTVTGSRNDYIDSNTTNNSNGICATADTVVQNDNATNASYFGDLGHTSSGFTGSGCSNNPFTGFGANSTYLFDPDGAIDFAVGSSTNSLASFNWFVGGYTATTQAMILTHSSRLGLGTTTPQWLAELASSTNAQLALTSTSATGNFHWTFNNIFGNLFIATSSATTFGTSTNADPNTGYIEFPNNGGCIGCSDILLPDGVNLRNGIYISATTSSALVGNTFRDIYTAPTGRRAYVNGATFFNTTAGTINLGLYIKSSGTYYNVGATSSPTTGSINATSGGIILEPGESASILQQTTGNVIINISVIEFDATTPVYSAKLANPSSGVSTTTIYTDPVGVSAILLPRQIMLPGIAAFQVLNNTASLLHQTVFRVRSGQVALNSLNQAGITASNIAANTLTSVALSSNIAAGGIMFNSGDSLQLALDGAMLNGSLIWVNIAEH